MPAETPAATATAGLPDDAAAAWQAAAEAQGGLAVDFAAAATGVAWRDGGLEVTMPAEASTAAAFLRRPEVAAGIGKALAGMAGRAVRVAVVTAAPAAVSPTAAARPTAVVPQVTLVREAAEHPLVKQARTLFDAAIRKVEPPPPRDAARPPRPVPVAVEQRADGAPADDDEAADGDGHG
ncbi:MAG: hypothetical protein ACKONH_03510 [Planctomycetia bacterium]